MAPSIFKKAETFASNLANRVAPQQQRGVRDAIGVLFSEDQQEKRMKGGETLDWLDDDAVIELTRHYFGRNMAYMELGEITKQNAWLHRKYRAMNIIVLAYQDAMDTLCNKVITRSHTRCHGAVVETKTKMPIAFAVKVDVTGKQVSEPTAWTDAVNLTCSICRGRDGTPLVVGKQDTTKEAVYVVKDKEHDAQTVDSWKHILAMVGRQMIPYTFKAKHLDHSPIAVTGAPTTNTGDEGGTLLRELVNSNQGGAAAA